MLIGCLRHGSHICHVIPLLPSWGSPRGTLLWSLNLDLLIWLDWLITSVATDSHELGVQNLPVPNNKKILYSVILSISHVKGVKTETWVMWSPPPLPKEARARLYPQSLIVHRDGFLGHSLEKHSLLVCYRSEGKSNLALGSQGVPQSHCPTNPTQEIHWERHKTVVASLWVRNIRELSRRQADIGFLGRGIFQGRTFWRIGEISSPIRDWWDFKLRDWWVLVGFQAQKRAQTFHPIFLPFFVYY